MSAWYTTKEIIKADGELSLVRLVELLDTDYGEALQAIKIYPDGENVKIVVFLGGEKNVRTEINGPSVSYENDTGRVNQDNQKMQDESGKRLIG